MNKSRKYFSASALLAKARLCFKKVKDPLARSNRKNIIPLIDCLMSSLALFGLKYPSLLQFDKERTQSDKLKHNLSTLYQVDDIPCDTYMRERLDEVDPAKLRKPFKSIFADLQRGKVLEKFQFLQGYFLVAIDGTDFFSSNNVSCENCCKKKHKDGTVTYYHQMFCGSLVSPSEKIVIPFPPESITKQDGATKNDCEINAAKRFINDLRKDHPLLKIIITSDSLLSKGPFIKILKEKNMSFILTAKPGDHKFLFESVKDICQEIEIKTYDGKIHKYRYINNVSLNNSDSNVIVNFIEFTETNTDGKVIKFSWVTNIYVTKNNIHKIMEGGRARWKIENETFNTLKNQKYHFDHNFGHGYKNLSSVFAILMMLAFLIDQVQELADYAFQQALLNKERKLYLWQELRSLFFHFKLTSWEDIWHALTFGYETTLTLNNSS